MKFCLTGDLADATNKETLMKAYKGLVEILEGEESIFIENFIEKKILAAEKLKKPANPNGPRNDPQFKRETQLQAEIEMLKNQEVTFIFENQSPSKSKSARSNLQRIEVRIDGFLFQTFTKKHKEKKFETTNGSIYFRGSWEMSREISKLHHCNGNCSASHGRRFM